MSHQRSARHGPPPLSAHVSTTARPAPRHQSAHKPAHVASAPFPPIPGRPAQPSAHRSPHSTAPVSPASSEKTASPTHVVCQRDPSLVPAAPQLSSAHHLMSTAPATAAAAAASAAVAAPAAGPNLAKPPAMRAMRRPGYGTAGRPVDLMSNFFPMRIAPSLIVYTHAVAIKRNIAHVTDAATGKVTRARRDAPGATTGWIDVSQIEPVFYNRNVFDLFIRAEGGRLQTTVAYDGRSIAYSARKLDVQCLNTDVELVVDEEGREVAMDADPARKRETIKVHIQSSSNELRFADFFARKVAHREPYLAALDVALANGPARTHVMVGRSFYSEAGAEVLGNRGTTAKAWRGFYQSVRLTNNGIMVNFDESFTAFWDGGGRPLMNLVRQANDGRDLHCRDSRSLRDVASRLKLLKVRTTHTGVTYKVHGFTDRGADEVRFDNREGKQVSIREYFSDTYGINLRCPQLPLVKVHPKRDTYFPMELLDVVDRQRMMGLLEPEQTRTIVRIASTKPHARMATARDKMRALLQKEDAVRDEFGIKVDANLVRLKGRVLPTPAILYRGETAKPENGQWRPRTPSFPAPAELHTWVVLNNSRSSEMELREFLVDFVAAAKRGGVKISNPNPQIVNVGSHRISDEMKMVHQQFRQGQGQGGRFGLQLMIVINMRQESALYNEIKRTGDLEMGVITQVLLANKATKRRQRNMYCDNVMLKVNAKLGGQNAHVAAYSADARSGVRDVSFINRPHIVLGADVTHPMPGGKTCSVAALVGSRDRQGVQYSASIRNQKGRTEIIQQLGDMFKEVYIPWRNNFRNTVDAHSVIMFRDGVADGQYEQVLAVEVASLRRACEELGEQFGTRFRPKITYIIVTKRHHARFFSEDRRAQDRSGNVMPGTVVDATVTSADYYDFYVNSHAGIQGTSKPSKYVVLLDENNMGVDELQGYVFRLSHGFSRCNRSVSMVNSAYYAHLLAFRGRAYLNEDSDGGSSRYGDAIMPTARIDPLLKRRLFFV